MLPRFVHLHCHTEYSLLDCTIRIKSLIAHCKENDVSAIAITDNGTMYGVIEFYLEAKAAGIKPIVGCEMYLTQDMTQKERGLDRLILLCQNYTGYQNLIRLVTRSHIEGFYYKPRIDLAALKGCSEGLIAISPGHKGPIAYALMQNQVELAQQKASHLKTLFEDRFYLGLQPPQTALDQMAFDGSLALGTDLNIDVVATNDVYFLEKGQGSLRTILNCVRKGRTYEGETDLSSQTDERFLKSAQDMESTFSAVPQALENTIKISDQCHLEIITEQVQLPRFECPDNLSSEAYLEQLVMDGLQKKYPEITPDIQNRVQFELSIIQKMEYPVYFLIIYDFLAYARQNNIPVGPGRGSAAGSIVAYVLNITDIDPIRYNLLFERFLNPDRVSMPDIDLDFCIKRRGEIIDYIVKKYGSDNVSQIVTFGTMAARGVVRDVGRVLDIPLSEVDALAKLVPSSPGTYTSIPEAIESVPEIKKRAQTNPDIARLLEVAEQLEGLARHTSTHAAGVVISRDPLSSVVPLVKNEGQIVTQYPMTDLEKIGLLKMDILGLRNLTVIQDALDLIQTHRGETLDLSTLPLDDAKTYQLLCNAQTIGVFQLESRGMRQLIKDLQPQVFEDIIALLALYRPGPLGSGMVSDFISNKSGKTKVKYDLPELEPILKDTYGMIVYQEQVMQIASTVGGFSLGQADMLRRAMGKKKKDVMDKMKDAFLAGAKDKTINPKTAERIFDLCYKFAEYGFNKSHSAAYALISYQTAYLKANYPQEYMAALLSSVLMSSDKTSLYIQECAEMEIPISPPDVNQSMINFSLNDSGILFGLGAVKNVGEGAIEAIITTRKEKPFGSLTDFCLRVDLKQVNKRVVESLIKCGAFDQIEGRYHLLKTYEQTLERAQTVVRERQNGQTSLFGTEQGSPLFPEEKQSLGIELPHQQKLKLEKEMLGLYISGHPLDQFESEMAKLKDKISTLTPKLSNQTVTLMGILSECRRIVNRNKREMVLAKLGDQKMTIDVLLFQGPEFEEKAAQMIDDQIVKITGKIRHQQDELSMFCEHIVPVDESTGITHLHIDLDHADRDALAQLKTVFEHFSGETPVYLHVEDATILAHRRFWIGVEPEPMQKIESIIGKKHVWIA